MLQQDRLRVFGEFSCDGSLVRYDGRLVLLALFVLVVKKVSFWSYTKQKSGKSIALHFRCIFCKVLSRVLFQLTGQFA